MRKITLLLLASLLCCAGCNSWNKNRDNTVIYQAESLRVKAGTAIQTVDGVYTSQCDELWISEKTYTEVLNKYINLLDELGKSGTATKK